MQRAYDHLGRPARHIPTILVGGTNGKGSTASYLYRLLVAQGHRVGLYSSPHLNHFSERIVVSDHPTDDDACIWELESQRQDLGPFIESSLSFFEITTLMALRRFQRFDVDVVVLEVGLGGRWDATNVVEPKMSIITNIGLDHQSYLGNSLGQIAFEKSGIMRKDSVVVYGGATSGEAFDMIKAQALEKGAELKLQMDSTQMHGSRFSIGETDYEMPPEFWSVAPYQIHNFIGACYALEQSSWRLGSQALAMGKRPPCGRGRFERQSLTDGGDLFIDVCHNPDGVRSLIQALDHSGVATKHPEILVSILRDKPIGEMLDLLRQRFSVRLFGSRGERGMGRSDVPASHKDLDFFPTYEEALGAARQQAPNAPVVVCGSILVLGDLGLVA
jgi:dihydrofolate synthase/folylpolyglutamate synthase